MPPLYVIQQNARIRIQNRRVTVSIEEEGVEQTLTSLPIGQVDEIVLFGNISLTTPAISACLTNGITVVFLSQVGSFRGHLQGTITPHVPIRRALYVRSGDPVFQLAMAKSFVDAKLRHQRTLLQRHLEESQKKEEIQTALSLMSTALEGVSHKTNMESLRGLEGSATAAYFRGLRTLFSSDWKFDTRQRRPPPDPINVLLSFGYTLLSNLASGAVQSVGLDPYVGFLHEYVYNRPALGLDLMEEFRPVIDGVILSVCKNKFVTPQNFVSGKGELPVLLDEKGKKSYIQQIELRFDKRFTHPISGQQLTLRQCLIEQARQIVHCVVNNKPGIRPMGFR